MTSPWYELLNKFMTRFKLSLYALVVLLNISVLMSPNKLNQPLGALRRHLDGTDELEQWEWVSLTLTLCLGGLNFFGYFVVVYFIGKTKVPLVMQQVREEMEEMKETLPKAEWKNWGAWNYWAVTLVFNVLFCFMHFINYKSNPSLYAATVFGINLPWTLSCIRNYIVVADTPRERSFVIAFELIVRQPFFRNHVVLQVFSILGFQESMWFTLMLLDVINNSQLLMDIGWQH